MEHPFQGLQICSILQDQSIQGTRQMESRRFHGFIIKLKGATEYTTDENQWLLEAGQILFVPQGSSYQIRQVEPGYSYVVNFTCPAEPKMGKLPLPPEMDITHAAEKLLRSYQKGSIYGALGCLYGILEKTDLANRYVSPREKQLLEPVLAYLQAHLTDADLDVGGLAEMAGVSQVYLRRVFKKQQGISPAGFVIRQRLQLAQQLLSNEQLTVAQVAAMSGFRDPLYFSRLFKKQLGLSPTEYCAYHRNDLF